MIICQRKDGAVGVCRQAMRVWFAVLVLILLAGCSPTLRPADMAGPTSVTMKVDSTINGMRRRALVHLPHSFSYQKRWPLVVVLHGAFSTAEKMEETTGFSDLADREGFVVLYPEGMGLFGFLQHWNAGHCCGKAAEDGVDDVAFIDECITRLGQLIPLDPKRVYITGFSNGGMMAHRFAAEKSSRVVAVAALGAAVGGRPSMEVPIWLPMLPQRPVAAMLVHGTADGSVPIGGGSSPERGGERQYLSFPDSVSFWLEANDCSDQAGVEETFGGLVEIERYSDCRSGAEVIAYVLHGWGHRWPGEFYTRQDESLKGVDISREIWRFFHRFSRSQ